MPAASPSNFHRRSTGSSSIAGPPRGCEGLPRRPRARRPPIRPWSSTTPRPAASPQAARSSAGSATEFSKGRASSPPNARTLTKQRASTCRTTAMSHPSVSSIIDGLPWRTTERASTGATDSRLTRRAVNAVPYVLRFHLHPRVKARGTGADSPSGSTRQTATAGSSNPTRPPGSSRACSSPRRVDYAQLRRSRSRRTAACASRFAGVSAGSPSSDANSPACA